MVTPPRRGWSGPARDRQTDDAPSLSVLSRRRDRRGAYTKLARRGWRDPARNQRHVVISLGSRCRSTSGCRASPAASRRVAEGVARASLRGAAGGVGGGGLEWFVWREWRPFFGVGRAVVVVVSVASFVETATVLSSASPEWRRWWSSRVVVVVAPRRELCECCLPFRDERAPRARARRETNGATTSESPVSRRCRSRAVRSRAVFVFSFLRGG